MENLNNVTSVDTQKVRAAAMSYFDEKKEDILKSVQAYECMSAAIRENAEMENTLFAAAASAAIRELEELKNTLFEATYKELQAFLQLKNLKDTQIDIAFQRARFASLYKVIENAGLMSEYGKWKKSNETSMQATA